MKASIKCTPSAILFFKLKSIELIYILCFLPFLGISWLKNTLPESLYSGYQVASTVILFLLVLRFSRLIKLDLFCWSFLLYHAVILFSTVFKHGISWGIIVTTLACIFCVLLAQVDIRRILHALSVVFFVCIVLNTFSIFSNTETIHPVFFIGGKNAFSVFLVPACFTVLLYARLSTGHISKSVQLFVVISMIMTIWAGSATGIVTVLAMTLGLLWIMRHRLNVKLSIFIVLIANFVLIFLSEILAHSPLWVWFTGLFSKDATLTSRMMIWSQALSSIGSNILLGTGRGTGIAYTSKWGYTVVSGEAHNHILEILFEGGLAGFFFYCVFFWQAVKNLNMTSLLHRIAFLAILILFINGFAEAITNKLMVYLIIAFAYSISKKGITGLHYGKQV